MSVRLNLPPSYRLAMQHTNTPAWEAASTAASTRPRRIERERENKKRSKVIHMPAIVFLWCNNVRENEAKESVAFNDKVVEIT